MDSWECLKVSLNLEEGLEKLFIFQRKTSTGPMCCNQGNTQLDIVCLCKLARADWCSWKDRAHAELLFVSLPKDRVCYERRPAIDFSPTVQGNLLYHLHIESHQKPNSSSLRIFGGGRRRGKP